MMTVNKFKIFSVLFVLSAFGQAHANSCLQFLDEGHRADQAYYCQAESGSLLQNSLKSLSLCFAIVQKERAWAHGELRWELQDESSSPWIYKTQYSEKIYQTHYLPPSSLVAEGLQNNQSELTYIVRSEGSYWQEILDVQRSFSLNKVTGQGQLQLDLRDPGLLLPGLWQNWIDVSLSCTQIR